MAEVFRYRGVVIEMAAPLADIRLPDGTLLAVVHTTGGEFGGLWWRAQQAADQILGLPAEVEE